VAVGRNLPAVVQGVVFGFRPRVGGLQDTSASGYEFVAGTGSPDASDGLRLEIDEIDGIEPATIVCSHCIRTDRTF